MLRPTRRSHPHLSMALRARVRGPCVALSGCWHLGERAVVVELDAIHAVVVQQANALLGRALGNNALRAVTGFLVNLR
jgi:hypothetical protein